MRIGVNAICLEGKRTGVGRYLESLLREWSYSCNNDEFHLYYLNEEPHDEFLQVPNIKKKRICMKELRQNDIFEWELRNHPVDVFFSPLYDLPSCVGSPAVITVHDMIHEAYPESFNEIQLEYLKTRTEFGIKKANTVITDSLFSCNEIISYFPFAADKVEIIPLAPSPFFRIIDNNADFIKNRFGMSNSYILYVGAVTPKRHIKPVFDSFSKISQNFPEWSVIAIGRNVVHPPEDLYAMTDQYNRTIGRKALIYEEFVNDEELLMLYNHAEIFIYLSSYEGFGMPPLEAMACGTAVVTSSMSSLLEVVGDAAVTLDSFEIATVAQSLSCMMKDECLRNEYREKGLNHVKRFSWKITAEQTIEAIKKSIVK